MGLGRGIFAATIQLTEEAAVPMGAMEVVAEASWVFAIDQVPFFKLLFPHSVYISVSMCGSMIGLQVEGLLSILYLNIFITSYD